MLFHTPASLREWKSLKQDKKYSEEGSQEYAEKLMSSSGQVEVCETAEKRRAVFAFGSCAALFPQMAFGQPLCGHRQTLFPVMVTSNHGFDVENWEGVRANIQDITESTLYHDHELAASQKILKSSVWNERHTQELFGTTSLMTLKFWVANRKIWKHRWCFDVLFHVMAMTIERREALRTSGCRHWWRF